MIGRAGYFYRQLVRTSEVPERYRGFSGGLRGTWTPDLVNSVDFSYAFDQYDKSDYQRITRLDIRDYSNVQNSLRLLYNHTFEGETSFLWVQTICMIISLIPTWRVDS